MAQQEGDADVVAAIIVHDAAHVPASENPLIRLVRGNCCDSVS